MGDRFNVVAASVLLVVLISVVLAPIVGPAFGHYPDAQNLLIRLEPPSIAYPLGTDELGRDILIRVLAAGRVSLLIGALATSTSLVIGVSLGILAGYYRQWVDDAINALILTTVNIPLLFLLILVSVLFSPGVVGLAFVIGLLSWQGTARQVRAQVLSISQRNYVEAARALGAGEPWVMVRHILPNVLSIVLVIGSFDIAGAILAESGLSALGLGVQPPTASWGNMLAKSFEYATKESWLVAAPGTMIFATLLCVLVSADGLRDSLDPQES